jgi:hypothetical protein
MASEHPPTPVNIDITKKSEASPVYVYGASGRCWKFASRDMVQPYFKRLIGSNNPIAIVTNLHYLFRQYGTNIDIRLKEALKEGVRPCDHDYEITITNADGKEDYINPRAIVFDYKKAAIKITLPKTIKYSITELCTKPEIPFAYLITKNEAEHSEALETINIMIHRYDYELLKDYLLGDQQIHERPIVQAPIAAPDPDPVPPAVVQREWRRSLFRRLLGGTEPPPRQQRQPQHPADVNFIPLLIEVE